MDFMGFIWIYMDLYLNYKVGNREFFIDGSF